MYAIRTVLKGGLHFSVDITESIMRQTQLYRSTRDHPLSQLSDRELEILEAIGRGHQRRHIAQELGLSVKTISTYCENLKEKLNLSSMAALSRYAVDFV